MIKYISEKQTNFLKKLVTERASILGIASDETSVIDFIGSCNLFTTKDASEMILLTLLFQKTKIGLALRASAFSPEIARLSGIKVDMVRTFGWAIAGSAGGMAGMLYVPGSFLHPNAMDVLLVFGFVAAVIGGLDSLFGAVAGAMILGFAINFATSYISYKLVFTTAFGLLILVLLIKPNGLFSSSKSRKD